MNWRDPLAWLAAFCAALFLLWLSDGPGWRYGYTYRGDEFMILVQMQSLLESGDTLASARLAAPWGSDWHSFPMRTPIECGVARLAFLAGCNAFEALSLIWVVLTGLTALTAYATLRHLDIGRAQAYLLAVLFALQSYTWEHNLWHLHCYYAWVPGTCLGLIFLAQGKPVPRWLSLNAFLAGLSSIYYNFFCIWLLPLALLLGWRKSEPATRRTWGWLALAWGLGLFLHVAQIAHRPAQTTNAQGNATRASGMTTSKDPAQAEMYSLRLRHLLCPRPNHPLLPWSFLENKLDSDFQARVEWYDRHQSEATRGRLNTLASLGLLLSLYHLWKGCRDWAWLASLYCWATLLIASTSGLGPVFNGIFFERLRCYNRMQVYLCFFCLALLGRHLPRKPWVLLLLPFGLIDQFQPVSAYVTYPVSGVASQWQHDRDFVQAVEAKLPPGTALFQLPAHYAFTQPDVQLHGEYSGAIPYLFSRQLRWSWGYLGGEARAWNDQIKELPLREQLLEMQKRGFTALWWDRYGYLSDPQALRLNLPHYLGQPLAVSPNGRYQVFSLSGEIPEAEPLRFPEPLPKWGPSDYPHLKLSVSDWPKSAQVYRKTIREVSVRVENQGTKLLYCQSEPDAIHLSYHWIDEQGEPVIIDGLRTLLPPLPPGDSLVIPLRVATPASPGRYRLQVRLVHESTAWVEDGGVDLEVVAPY